MAKFNRILLLPVILLGLLLAGCDNEGSINGATGVVDPTAAAATGAASIVLVAEKPQLTSSSDSVLLTAIVKDANNALLASEPVTFAATSGDLLVTAPITNTSGVAEAKLTTGVDASNRTITVTATAGTVSATYDILVTGTSISINGSTSVVSGTTIPLTVTLQDSAGNGIPGAAITVSVSDPANSYSTTSGSLLTDLTGSVTVSALGSSATQTVNVSSDSFQITVASEVEIQTCAPISVEWLLGITPQVGNLVDFVATRGVLYTDAACTTAGSSATTNASGIATVYVTSPNPGISIVTATASTISTRSEFEFVATTPASLSIRADIVTLSVNSSSTIITAVVRDASNNLVKNIPVTFTLLKDATAGAINPGQDTTDSLGRASTVYTASSVTSAKDGVVIEASVPASYGVSPVTIALTVANQDLFVTFGLADKITTETSASYAHPGTLFVIDAAGNPVAGATVNLTVIPTRYEKGYRQWDGVRWVPISTITGVAATPPLSCANEDFLTADPTKDGNGVLDAGEDINGNGSLEPGNVATVERTLTTDQFGMAEFNIRYPKDKGSWTQVKLVVTAGSISGTETTDTSEFVLAVADGDVTDLGKTPPGPISPYGVGAACTDPN